LFLRIVKDPDFRAARLDTGYLDRLLAKPYAEDHERHPLMAAIAAGIFATIDAERTFPGANGRPAPARGEANGKPETSRWRRAARREALQ
jgi:acetyl-CoA carboxylase biotin carboxylase subunit